ncbi:hypothetical protein Tco_0044421 [Tanacetum coccineum]
MHDHQLAERLQAQEQEELSVKEKATLFQQLLAKRRKHFAAKRAEEKRNKPPTKAQQRKIMCTYLKNMEGYKLNDLKLKEFDSIQEMFDRAYMIYMLVEKKYPLTPSTLTMMLEKKLMIDYESKMAYQLLKFIGRIVGIKSLLDAVRITVAQVDVNTALMKRIRQDSQPPIELCLQSKWGPVLLPFLRTKPQLCSLLRLRAIAYLEEGKGSFGTLR